MEVVDVWVEVYCLICLDVICKLIELGLKIVFVVLFLDYLIVFDVVRIEEIVIYEIEMLFDFGFFVDECECCICCFIEGLFEFFYECIDLFKDGLKYWV